ncbi:MAG: hypothetical protein DSZ00_06335 [Gammaproteobacteria bacterium]|nr:MAG: hypothetical protein DSZ00_06335 [Gammaproteobacteria bacterium]
MWCRFLGRFLASGNDLHQGAGFEENLAETSGLLHAEVLLHPHRNARKERLEFRPRELEQFTDGLFDLFEFVTLEYLARKIDVEFLPHPLLTCPVFLLVMRQILAQPLAAVRPPGG